MLVSSYFGWLDCLGPLSGLDICYFQDAFTLSTDFWRSYNVRYATAQVGDEVQSFYICLEAMYSIPIDRLTIP
jgi:hypothetical protein